ncbi:pilus assembly protein PilM [Halodesulfovibrio spirochaetisodalis]|uniref:GspL periplasmic domain-containing protein n=1 Tax=Halodesulfovibrio spirochaetisodalis TaxID=1560234 RepID=A0A1B7XB38_9BACT|nr:PilN domain-containing protein [Halodesulfovibrio spirochaetisodalis]OBQ46589.1 hypothetical protein SP90_11320 [Halodesulfovibrio spirochaetisodalis]
MHNKLLCITCSENHVSLCHFSGKKGTAVLEDYISFQPTLPLTAQSLATEIADAIDRNDLQAETYHLALNSQFAILRSWVFPFASESKIKQALSFELEQELPFPQEDAITDIQIGAKNAVGRNVISATIHKNFLSAFLSELQEHGIDPARIDLDAFALSNAISHIETKAPTLLLDIDAKRCLLTFTNEGQLVAVSQIPHGLSSIKQQMMRKLKLTEDAFERQLLFTNVAQPAAGESENVVFHHALSESLKRLAKSILLGINTSTASAETIFLSGEISKIQGVDQIFSEILDRSVTSVHKLKDAPVITNLEDKNDWIECLPAYGLMPSAKVSLNMNSQGMNFRKEEFSYHKKQDPITSIAKYATAIALCIMLAWAGSLYAEGQQKEKEVKILTKSIKKAFRTALPDVRGNFGTIQFTSILQTRLKQLKGEDSSTAHKQIAVIELLRALSENTPTGLDVNLEDISIDEKRIGLRGNTDSLNTLEKFRAGLSKSPLLENIEIRGANNQKKQRVRFELSIMRAS